MAKFKVIRAHDGLEAGTIKVLAPSPLTAKMVQNGYWAEIPESEPVKPAKSNKPSSKRKK